MKTKLSNADKYSFSGIPAPTKIGAKKKKVWPGKYIDRFLSDVPDGASILEIGPGKGEFADECLRKNWQYVGIDSSQAMMGILKHKKYNFINARVPPIPASNECFDCIHAAQVVEHFNSVAEFNFFLQECWRTLRKGGYLSITCPNYLTLGKIFYDWDYTHRLTFTKYNLVRACEDYSFEIIRDGFFLNLSVDKKFYFKILRHPLLLLLKFINMPILVEIFEKYKFTDKMRLRITKNLFDNIVVIAKKK